MTRARPRWLVDPGVIKIGVSSCLLGETVRFDGGHKRDPFIADDLADFVRFVRVCPEVELGLGTPRPAIRLEVGGEQVRLVDPKHGVDHTTAMTRLARKRVRQLENLELCGYVLKKDSPSCGMERVKIWNANGQSRRDGRGVFAAELMKRLPTLPIEEEGRLRDAALRENFIERVFAYRRLRTLFTGRWTIGEIVEFHTAHKHQLLAHSQARYRALGRLVAGARGMRRADLRDRYAEDFMAALRQRATVKKHTNVLQHMAGYVSRQLDDDSRQELTQLIEDYHRGLVPLVVPITLIRHHARRHGASYLLDQVYLDPHPKELMLRNHV